MTSNNHTYRLRPGRWSDLAPAARLYQLCFAQDYMVDVHFPNHRENPDEFRQTIHRMYQQRYWTPDYILTCLVDDDDAGRVVGCSWWRRPKDETSALYRWLSPYEWFCYFMRSIYSLRDTLFPLPSIDEHAIHTFERVLDIIKPSIFTTPRREQAWYLSILAVDPALQGKGLGSMLLRDGLAKPQQRGKSAYLIGLKGTDSFYTKFGFREVFRANVGELSKWDGGLVMFTE